MKAPFSLIMFAAMAATVLFFPVAVEATNWSSSHGCRKSPPSIQIDVPLVEGVVQVPKGAKLLDLGYRVKRDGLVYVNFRFESNENFIGVRTTEVNSGGLPPDAEPYVGREIHQVISETPAASAGLLPGDVILALDGEKLGRQERFGYLIKTHDLDTPVELEILRDKRTFKVTVELATRKVEKEDFITYRVATFSDLEHSGLVLGEVAPEVSRMLPESSRVGALVLHIEVGAPAFNSGLRVGDVITSMGESKVETAAAMIDVLSRAASSGDAVTTVAMRGTSSVETSVRPLSDTRREKSFSVPIAVRYEKTVARTRCEMGLGMVLDYERDSCFGRDGSPHEDWSFAMCLDLFKITRSEDESRLSLLWFININW